MTKLSLELRDVGRHAETPDTDRLRLVTDRDPIDCRLHPADGDAAVIWVFGSGGGLGGPARGLYTRLGRQLRPRGVASLELAYRKPGDLVECVGDVAVGAEWLSGQGKNRLVLVGHSFGGAVVVNAGLVTPSLAVAALSSQTSGTARVDELSPRPVLFIHGEADEILPASCSRDLHARAREPKRLILYAGCRHGLDECQFALDRDLLAWVHEVLGLPSNPKVA
jgi:fermentation-respiration switch protein FrsA (DUF1100 family)